MHPTFRLFVNGVVNDKLKYCGVLRAASFNHDEHLVAFVHLLLAVHLHRGLLDRNGRKKRIQNLTPHRGVRTYDGGILRLGDGPGLLFEPNLKIVPRQECGRKDIAHLACAIRTEAYATVTGLQTLATRLVDVDHIVVGIVEIIESDNMKRQKLVVNDTGMVEIEFLKMAADILERRRNKVA